MAVGILVVRTDPLAGKAGTLAVGWLLGRVRSGSVGRTGFAKLVLKLHWMINLHPRKPALCQQGPTTLEILVKISPDQLPPRRAAQRMPVNLALVLDRSGSMQGEKMTLTLQAACQAVDMLQKDDFLTVVIFDDLIETLYSGRVTDKKKIHKLIQAVEARNSTDLYGGWWRGAEILGKQVSASRLSRVVLLTDGQANHGVVDSDEICRSVESWTQSGVQTTTLGFGKNYEENLLRRMASSGGGNHGYIEDAPRLSAFFEEEMTSLLRTRGTAVRLSTRPAPGVVVEWLTPPLLDREGRVCLADLVEGQPLAVVMRLQIEPSELENQLEVELSWHDLEAEQRQATRVVLGLPRVDRETWNRLGTDPEVEAHLARAGAELRRQGAMELLRWGQSDAALQWLDWADQLPHLPQEDRQALGDLRATVERGDRSASYKKAAMYSHGHGSGHARVSSHYIEEVGPGLNSAGKRGKRLRIPLGDGPMLHAFRKWPLAPWKRLEGMLRGHFFGERLVRGNRAPLGEGAQLSMASIRFRREDSFEPDSLAQRLNEAGVLHPTTSQQKFRQNFAAGTFSLLDIGSPSAGCAALRRVCPMLVMFDKNPFLEAVAATLITHRDNLALSACLGYLGMLERLLLEALPPRGDFYLNAFLESLEGLAEGPPYGCKTGKFKGWEGHLGDFLVMAIGHAREQALSLDQAVQAWGSGPYLLEVVPTMLYALELHGHEPWQALLKVTARTLEPDTLGMLVGAAVGALHGSQPGWFLSDDLEKFLERMHSEIFVRP